MISEYVVSIDLLKDGSVTKMYERRVYDIDLIGLSSIIDSCVELTSDLNPTDRYEIKVKEISKLDEYEEIDFEKLSIRTKEDIVYFRQLDYLNVFDLTNKIERFIYVNAN